MKCKKLIPLLLSCLMLLDNPISPQAASFSSASKFSEDKPAQEQTVQTDLKVNLNQSTYTLKKGNTVQLTASAVEASGSDLSSAAQTAWSSNQEDVATVSDQGLVTAHKSGTAVITASLVFYTENGVLAGSSSCTITVADTITLNKENLTIYLGQVQQLTSSAAGAVTWTSSNPNIADVSPDGKITPKKAGSVTITAAFDGISASCKVTIKKPSLKLKSKATIYLDNPVILKAAVQPKGTVSWKSSNKKIATVNSKGVVKAKKRGSVKIKVKAFNGKSGSVKIKVKA